MRKEVIIAIVIGIAFGLLITFGIYQANQTADSIDQGKTAVNNPSPTPQTPQDRLFTLLSLEDGDILSTPTATISGNLKANTHLVIISENDEIFVTADKNGNYSEEIELNSGANTIKLTAITTEGLKEERELILVYTTASLE